MCLSLLDLQLDVPDHLLVLELGTVLIVHQEPFHPVLGCFPNLGEQFAHVNFAERHLLVLEILLGHVIDRFGLGRWHLGLQALESLGPVAHDTAILVQGNPWECWLELQSSRRSQLLLDMEKLMMAAVKRSRKVSAVVTLQVVLLGFHSCCGFEDLF